MPAARRRQRSAVSRSLSVVDWNLSGVGSASGILPLQTGTGAIDPLTQLAGCDSPKYTAFKEIFSQIRYGLPMADILTLLTAFGVIGIVLMVALLWRH